MQKVRCMHNAVKMGQIGSFSVFTDRYKRELVTVKIQKEVTSTNIKYNKQIQAFSN